MLVRVFEIPPPTGTFHFSSGEPQSFIEVDWFRDDPSPLSPERPPLFTTEEGRAQVRRFIEAKRYFDPAKAYLVLHPTHPFTMGYAAPCATIR
jgi:hypothetical protein